MSEIGETQDTVTQQKLELGRGEGLLAVRHATAYRFGDEKHDEVCQASLFGAHVISACGDAADLHAHPLDIKTTGRQAFDLLAHGLPLGL